jgi:hypothetical protein
MKESGPIDMLLERIAIFLVMIVILPASALGQDADLILENAQVYTPSGWAQALAVRDGVIVAVGDIDAVSGMAGNATQVIDLQGATVMPGLHDLHVHPMGAGLAQLQCNFPQGTGREALLAAVAACAATREAGEWINGGQWDAASFGDSPMHRRMLDEVAPDNPVSLVDISGHSIWVNSRALELAGITNGTLNPPGGVIEKDAAGDVTGVLRESATGLVRGIIPPESPQQIKEALYWSTQLMLSYGITSYTDAGVSGAALTAYAELADEGRLPQRINTCMMWRGAAFGGSDGGGMPEYVAQRNLYARERLAPDCIKIALDGVPTDGHTAAMVDPYADSEGTDDSRDRGILMVPAAELAELVSRWDAMGFQVKMHAAGDAAVRAGLDAIEAARNANGFSGRLHDVAHNSFVKMADIRRARGIGATFEMSPYIWYPNPIIPDIVNAVGEQRMQRWIPVKDAIDAGALVVPGSDWPVVPNVNPWIGIETLVTRQAPGGGGEALGAAERISLEQAVAMFTVNAARQLGKRHRTGAIERGMLADLVVIDRNIFIVPVTDIHNTLVMMTFIEGELVYEAD